MLTIIGRGNGRSRGLRSSEEALQYGSHSARGQHKVNCVSCWRVGDWEWTWKLREGMGVKGLSLMRH